ncbi:MAG: hypothetical protein V1772_00700 [Chloroflexota bacterium]
MERNRKRRMDETVAVIQGRWGPRALRPAAQADVVAEPTALSTGFANLDRALGGGLPRGHISELVGAGTAGQMTLAAKTLQVAQEAGQPVVYVDAWQSIDLDFLARCGVHLEPLVVLRPAGLAQALEMTGDLLRGRGAGAIVLDRLHPLVGAAELQGLNRVLPEWNALLSRTLCTLLIVSETIVPEDYPYGPTLPHVSYTRLGFAWQRWLYQRRRCTGFVAQVTVLKHRSGRAGVARPIEVTFHNGIHGAGR